MKILYNSIKNFQKTCYLSLAMLITLTFFHESIEAQIDADLESSFNEQLNDLAAEYDLVGFSAAVQLPNGETWTGATGISAEDEPLTPQHSMGMASNTKPFVAAAIFQLEEEGLLDLEDPLSNWVEEVEHIDGEITIEQLLRHRSGLYNFTDHPMHIPLIVSNLDSIWSYYDVLNTFVEEPIFAPGEEYSYSNTNYKLLGLIIEEITGETVHQVIKERVLSSNQLESTSFLPFESPVDPLSHIWSVNPITGTFGDLIAAGLSLNSLTSISQSAGNLFTTPGELTKMMYSLLEEDIIAPESLERMFEFEPAEHYDTVGWNDIEYGMGLYRANIGNQLAIGHTGNLLYRSACFYFPELDLTVTISSNDDSDEFERIVAIKEMMQAYLNWLPDGYLIDSELISTTPANETNYWNDIPDHYDVASYKLTYNTTGIDGMPTTATGLISIPQGTGCEELPMLVNCHGTVLKKLNVPSEMNYSGERLIELASAGFIGVAPDYLGLGESPGLHPYHHAETEATATIDMMHAAREFMEEGEIKDNGEVFVTGYSQGGHVAMATLEYAEENGMTGELGIVAGAPLSGAYDLSGIMGPAVIFEQVEYGFMGYIVFSILSWEMAYGNMFNKLEDLFIPSYVDQIRDWFDGEQNETSMVEVNEALPHSLRFFIKDSIVTDMQNNPTHPVWENLADNDTYNWAPQIPLRIYYCQSDNQVPYQNSIVAETELIANGGEDVEAIDVLTSGNHGQCLIPAYVAAYEFFEGLATMCDIDVSVDEHDPISLEVFPNPASSNVTIKTPETSGHMVVYDKTGKVVLQTNLVGDHMEIDVSSWTPGIYIAEFSTKRGKTTTQLNIAH